MLKIFLFIGALLLLVRCGTPVCVAGFGQCSSMFTTTTTTTTGTGSLMISGQGVNGSGTVFSNTTLTYTATGGSGTYNWSGSPTTVCSFGSPQIGTATFVSAGTCTIQATDASNPSLYGSATVTVSVSTSH